MSLGLVDRDITGRVSMQMGLPFGNATGVYPSMPGAGNVGPATQKPFSSFDAGDSYQGWNTQETIAHSLYAVFDPSRAEMASRGPDKFSKGQIVFVTRETEFERRPQVVYFVNTLSTLNHKLYEQRKQSQAFANVAAPIVMNGPENTITAQDILRRYNYMGVLDVVKPVGSDHGTPIRKNAVVCMMNCVIGGRVPICFNYWIDRPNNIPAGAGNDVYPCVREHMFLHLLLCPYRREVAPAAGGRAWEYWWQYTPVCTFTRQPPTYESVFGRDPVLEPLYKFTAAVYVGESSFLDDRTAVQAQSVQRFTFPGPLNQGIIDVRLTGVLPTLTVLVSHGTG